MSDLGRKQSFSLVDYTGEKIEKYNVLGWGNTINGELGLGDRIDAKEEQLSIPTTLPFSLSVKVRQIACGESHTLFVLEDGTLWSCGSNDHGQLGHENQKSRQPELVEGLDGRTIVRASAGYAQSFAIDDWGALYAWGSDSHGQLGLGLLDTQDKLVRRPRVVKSLATKVVVQVATGHFHSIVLTSAGEVYTCGSNSHGQLGIGVANGPNQTKPVLVELLVGFPAALITAGGFHCFILSKSAAVYGWGKNNVGQLGVGDTSDKCQPTQLATLRSLGVRYITAGSDHSAFLTHDGGVFTCGSSMYGQLGHGSLSNEVYPRKILEFGSVVTQIACGRCHTLCLANNKLYSFGLGSSGQLGDSSKSCSSPMHVTALKTHVYAVYAGGDQTFIVSNGSDNSVGPNVNEMEIDSGGFGVVSQQNGILDSCDYRRRDDTKQIQTITLEFVQQLASALEPVDQDLMTLVEIILASPACWNSSFINPKSSAPCTYKNIGIDLHLAAEVLSKLEGIKVSSLKELVDSVIYTNLLPKLPHQLRFVEILRVYVLIPLTPTFYEGTNPLQVFFAQRILNLPKELCSVVIMWLYNSPIEHITRLISVYKRLIVFLVDRYPKSKIQEANISKLDGLRAALCFLEHLHNQNRAVMRLSYHTFNIPQLSQKIDIRQELVNFLENKDRSRFVCFCDYPFVFDASAKTLLLQYDQITLMRTAMSSARSQFVSHPINALLNQITGSEPHLEIQYLNMVVSRQNIVQDTIQQLYHLNTHDLKKPLRVKFVGEEAEDAGGVRKEFFLLIIREILDPKYGMFRHYEESRLMWFNPETFEEDTYFFIIGLICGLAIYNFTIINLPFPLALYKKLLDEKVDINDLKELMPPVANSLQHVLDYTGDDFEDTFNLTFEISQESFGETKVIPLKPGGDKISVTLQNKAEFVDLYINYIFNTSVQRQFDAFRLGFLRVCVSTILNLFHAQELQAMIVGNEDYDWGELERNCTYKGIYHPKHPTILMFWEVFHSLSLSEKKQFLLFLTGSDRIPLVGMRAVKITIQPTQDERYLPVAHTCFNLLDLPQYQTKERLKYKLLQAIQQNQGFSLV
ncbi:unnamed protein product [Allacma fusca]|uniref:HECT domain-containing protein n=1 Tax=Allacma fusca TaxID=39272 RepID=A0A8J2J7Y2_9HEXA|nr:unnamed protein product [Allacma fusca]